MPTEGTGPKAGMSSTKPDAQPRGPKQWLQAMSKRFERVDLPEEDFWAQVESYSRDKRQVCTSRLW